MRAVIALAPAKINLHLRVLGRRPDGFHDVHTVFQAVDLCDRVTVEATGAPSADATIELEVVGTNPGPADENLALLAARAYRAATGFDLRLRITLEKRLPAGAGLGGGSSDAAAVLRCLALLAGDDDAVRLARIGAGLGSDVPFLIGPQGLAVGTGRGEILHPLPALPERDLVLVLPPVHVSTADAYRRLAATRDEEDGEPEAASATEATPGERANAERASDARAPGARAPAALPDWSTADARSHNDFERVIVPRHQEIALALDALRRAGGRGVAMSGSGSASFGFFDDGERAAAAAARLSEELGWHCVAARTMRAIPGARAVTP